MKLSSPVFENGGDIPEKYTFDGNNWSPPLGIENPPENTQSFVLVLEDLDSPLGTFTHWLVWNLPANTGGIEENRLPPEAQIGVNGFGEVSYGGPCPPSGRHRYRFRLLALDVVIDATHGDRKDQIESEIEDNVIGRATLTGYYQAKP